MEITLVFTLISILISITTWAVFKIHDLERKIISREEVDHIYRIMDNNQDRVMDEIKITNILINNIEDKFKKKKK